MSHRVADTLAIVEAMTPTELGTFLDHLAGSARVEATDWRVRERRECPERFPDRNASIRAARERGLRYGQISRLFGLERGTVAKIIQRGKKCVYGTGVHIRTALLQNSGEW